MKLGLHPQVGGGGLNRHVPSILKMKDLRVDPEAAQYGHQRAWRGQIDIAALAGIPEQGGRIADIYETVLMVKQEAGGQYRTAPLKRRREDQVLIVGIGKVEQEVYADHPRPQCVQIAYDPGQIRPPERRLPVFPVEILVDGHQNDLIDGERHLPGIAVVGTKGMPEGDGLVFQQGEGFEIFRPEEREKSRTRRNTSYFPKRVFMQTPSQQHHVTTDIISPHL